MNTHKIEVRGRITCSESKVPVSDADVRVGVRCSREILGFSTTATDRDGRYAVSLEWTGPEVGELMIDARALGHTARCWPWQCLQREALTSEICTTHAGDERVVDIELDPGFSVDILVEDPEGKRLPGVVSTVICTSSEAKYCHWPLTYQVYGPGGRYPRTDIDGHLTWKGFSARLLPGERYVISLQHEKYPEHLIQSPEKFLRENNLAKMTVRLRHGVTLSGRVTDRDGKAVEDASVQAIMADVTGEVPGCHQVEKTVRSGEDGAYRIPGLAAGVYAIRAAHPEWRETLVSNVKVAATDLGVDLQLSPGAVVSGCVLDATGAPVVGALVSASWRRPQRGRKQTETDQCGTFRLRGLPPRHGYRVESRSPDNMQTYGYCKLRGAKQGVVFDQREHAVLSGCFMEPSGTAPVPDTVECRGWTADDFVHLGRTVGDRKDGAFRISVPAGGTVVTFESGGRYYGEIKASLKPGESRHNVRLVAKPGAAILVRVIDAGTSQPVPGALVEVNLVGAWRRGYHTETVGTGEVTIANLPPVKVWLQVICPGYQMARSGPYRLRAGKSRGMVIHLEKKHECKD